MDDDEGMESFNIDDRDLDYALNPRRHFQSKDQATYGIWADSDEEEDGGRPSKFDRKGDRRKPDYSKGVSFVSGGVKQGSSLVKEDKDEQAEVEIDFSRPPSFAAPAPKRPKHAAGGNVLAGMRLNSNSAAPDPSKFGDWAKHGKGSVIMNMMKSMGYEQGKGLGREGQGIIEPVQAAVRAGRGAVGAYGREVTGPKFGESAADAQRRAAEESSGAGAQDDNAKPAMPKGAWKKNARVKVAYRTIDDVMADEGSIGMRAAKHSGEKVIDMTGPEQRVYTGYEALSMKSVRGETDDHRKFDIPELSHNLNLLIDLTEEDIRKSNHRARNLENSSTALRYDLKLAKEELDKEEEDLDRMKKVYKLLESLQDSSTSMDQFKSAFRRLRSEFTSEYTLLELEKVAVPCILPQIKEMFAKWQPLQRDQVAEYLDLMEEWKEILEPPTRENSLFKANTSSGGGGLVDDKLAAFDRLMWDGWMPPVRTAMLRWDPRDEMESMMLLVQTWLPVMPPWMRDKFIEQLLVPRITTRVEEWDPLTDPKPIHQWLVPWKEVVGDRLLPVFAPIRQKLSRALKRWTSTDNSALLILTPWRDVWTPATMSAFVQQNIVPKLREGLIQMNLDPSRNALYKEFTACISWMIPEGLITPDVIANLLVETFFPRWYETLCFWLDSPSVVLAEVQTWNKEWHAKIPPILMAFPAVKEWLRRGLIASMGGQRPAGPVPGAAPQPLLAPAPPPPPPVPRGAPDVQLSLKDTLERMAAIQGFTYIPQNGRFKEGKQVYWFGSQSIFVSGNTVYVMDLKNGADWRAISAAELIEIA